jgi:hypothetical protein
MRRVGRRVRVGFLAAVALATGGGCAAPPPARDPLVRAGRGVRGDRQAAAAPTSPPAEPVGPEAPPGPLIGDPAYAGLTSR